MSILERIIGELKEAFQYFQSRSKNKYYGDRFEEWVVKNSNISKNLSNPNDGKSFWKLLEWRGDKHIDGYSPTSSSSPDLLLECVANSSPIYKTGEIIAVECKWRSKTAFFLNKTNIEKYEEYINACEPRFPIKNLFYVFGFGWSCDKPNFIYIIPAKELYDYNKGTNTIRFPNENSEDKQERLDKYKHLTNTNTGYLMYRPERYISY